MVKLSVGNEHELTWSNTTEKAKAAITKDNFDLLLIDVQLPDGNGIELCNEILSSGSDASVFFLTSKADTSDKILGFSVGADDYITKPFDVLELKARIQSRLIKRNSEILKSNVMEWKEVKIDKDKQSVTIKGAAEESIDLTSLEFKLLIYMANRPESVIKREDMLDAIWGKDVYVYPRSVDTHMSKLRKKLKDVGTVIESVHGVGYKFSPTKM